MKSLDHRKLAMAGRVVHFNQAQQSTDPGYPALAGSLEERVARADAVLTQERDGLHAEHVATDQRRKLQSSMQKMLHHLVLVAKRVPDEPDWAKQFFLPSTAITYLAYINAAKSMLAAALPFKDQLVSLGIGATMLDDLGAAIAAFDAASVAADAGRRAHVASAKDLPGIAAECVQLVNVMNGINQSCFKDDPEQLAAWNSARNVVGPFRGKKSAAPAPDAPPAVVPPPASRGDEAA